MVKNVKFIKVVFLFLTTAFLTILASTYFIRQHGFPQSTGCVCENELDVDALEYHFIASNFALHNKFPVFGYLSDTAKYNICTNASNKWYLDMVKQNGPVVFLSRPPLFPLIVGTIYKLTGYNTNHVYRFNLFLLSLLVALMPIVGWLKWHWKGAICGFAGTLLFIHYNQLSIYRFDIEMFASFITFALFAFGLWLGPKSNPIYYFVFGVAVAFSMLTKGIFILVIAIYVVYFLLGWYTSRRPFFKPLSALLIGCALTLLPWIIYINIAQQGSQVKRAEWSTKLAVSTEPINVTARQDLFLSEGTLKPEAFEYFVKILYLHYLRPSGFIILSNQGGGDGLLYINNEFSLDGGLHPEWVMITTSYYRTHDNGRSTLYRLSHFFVDHPSYLVLIPVNKILRASSGYLLFIWLAAALWGLSVIQKRVCQMQAGIGRKLAMGLVIAVAFVCCYFSFSGISWTSILLFLPVFFVGLAFYRQGDEHHLPFIVAVFFLNFIGISIIVYGDGRFLRMLLPIAAICNCYFLLHIFLTLFTPLGIASAKQIQLQKAETKADSKV